MNNGKWDLTNEKDKDCESHLRRVICEAIRPDEIKVVFELALGLVLLRLYLLKH